jgi:hypothetical protein
VYYSLLAADKDSMVFNSGKTSNRILFNHVTKYPKNRPEILRTGINASAFVFPAYPGKLQITRFFEKIDFKNGKSEEISITGKRPDSTYIGGDTALIRFRRIMPDSSLTDSLILAFSVSVPQNVFDSSGHKLISYSARKCNTAGAIKNTEFLFVPYIPVTTGYASAGGTLELRISFRNGTSGTVFGAYSDGIISAIYTAPDGLKYSIKMDGAGKLLESRKI